MFYCQCYFYSPETNFGYQVKLFNLVRPNDHPCFDAHGKTSLWIDDIQWSPNDLTCIIAFRAKSIAIITRLGSLVRYIIDPSKSILQSPKFNKEKLISCSNRFHELVFSRDALNTDPTLDKDKIKIIFNNTTENDKFIVKDNKTSFTFQFKLSNDYIMSLLSWCEKEELGF
jgi:hypothetical protein